MIIFNFDGVIFYIFENVQFTTIFVHASVVLYKQSKLKTDHILFGNN